MKARPLSDLSMVFHALNSTAQKCRVCVCVCVCMFMYVCIWVVFPADVHTVPVEARREHQISWMLLATMWVLGIEPESSGSALNC